MKKTCIALLLLACLLLAACGAEAESQPATTVAPAEEPSAPVAAEPTSTYPDHALNILLPMGAGGATDSVVRMMAQYAQQILNVPITVTNNGGSQGAICYAEGAAAAPDGYTVTCINTTLATTNILGICDVTEEDFEPVIEFNYDPCAIVVQAEAPWDNLQDLAKDAAAAPESIKMATAAPGGPWALCGLLYEAEAGVTFHKITTGSGAAGSLIQLLGGHVDVATASPNEVATYVEGGLMKILGVANEERLEAFPDVPTCIEQGYDVVIYASRGLAVPKGTPQEVIDTLHDAFKQVLENEEYVNYMNSQGSGVYYLNGADMKDWIISEKEHFRPIYEQLGIEVVN